MKLQHLSVIFIIIMLPISLIISAYTQMQIDTLVLQQQYDAKLMDATYDAIKAFDMNTTSNNLSNVPDTVRKDILAAISTFMSSLADSMGVPGYIDEYIKPYVPALLFTLHDGYYIYAPTLQSDGTYTYTLQPYNYYSVRYKTETKDIVVNYTLDNYLVVYGYIGDEYVVKSGYLELESKDVKSSETIKENIPVAKLEGGIISEVKVNNKDVTTYNPKNITSAYGEYLYPRNDLYYIDPESASKYYKESKDFTDWVKDKLKDITPANALRNNKKITKFNGNTTEKIFNFGSYNDPNDSNSIFNQHRIEIIQDTIEDHLNYVITAYSRSLGGNTNNYNFRMPQLDPSEWITIASNICMVSFVQGMPVGSRFYNNYAIVSSTTNKFFVDPENIYFVIDGINSMDDYYHKIDCPYLKENWDNYRNSGYCNIIGFSNYNFQPFKVHISEKDEDKTYFKRTEKACYYCIIENLSNENTRDDEGKIKISLINDSDIEKAYYTAVAREKYTQYKTTQYFGS